MADLIASSQRAWWPGTVFERCVVEWDIKDADPERELPYGITLIDCTIKPAQDGRVVVAHATTFEGCTIEGSLVAAPHVTLRNTRIAGTLTCERRSFAQEGLIDNSLPEGKIVTILGLGSERDSFTIVAPEGWDGVIFSEYSDSRLRIECGGAVRVVCQSGDETPKVEASQPALVVVSELDDRRVWGALANARGASVDSLSATVASRTGDEVSLLDIDRERYERVARDRDDPLWVSATNVEAHEMIDALGGNANPEGISLALAVHPNIDA